MTPRTHPACPRCGYDLTGLRVDGVCPECGTSIWSPSEHDERLEKTASAALAWGVASLVLFFTCLVPVSGLVAIPAIVSGGRYRAEVRSGRARSSAAARVGLVCGWITVGLSIAVVALYVLLFTLAPLLS